jgi:hypothetical protein
MTYENVFEEFNKRNCKLVTTREEYENILTLSKSCNYKLNYIASCGHQHVVFYNVFKSRGTGIICSSCKNKQIGEKEKEKIKNNEIEKIYKIEQEFNFIMKMKGILINDFDFMKAFDGCKVDVIFKPKNIVNDKWVGIQVKTTKERRSTYSFHIKNNYTDCLILLHSIDDETTWLIPENIIGKQTKISIGYKKSKYNIYKISKENVVERLNELYNATTQFSFSELNLPINYYQQREQEFRKYREEIIPFIKFDYPEMEGTVYDFKIGNLKIQEKVSVINSKNYAHFCIYKNNGTNKNYIQYDVGDNDFYWLNCEDKKTFFVIPEKMFIDKGIIANDNKNYKTQLSIKIQTSLNQKSIWLIPYMFHYHNIEKDRLLKLLNQK